MYGMEEGIAYIATGQEYVEEAIRSAEQTRRVIDRPIALITDQKVSNPAFNEVVIDKNPQHDYVDKARNLSKSPFDRTLFLDTDVYLIEEIDELFAMLSDFDLAATVDPNEHALRDLELQYYDEFPESVPEYDTGILAYADNERMDEFFDAWQRCYQDEHVHDQVSFRKALATTDVQFTALSNNYNCLINWPVGVTGDVKIIHDVNNKIRNRHDIERIAGRINRSSDARVFHSVRDHVAYPLSGSGDRLTRGVWRANRALLLTEYYGSMFRESWREDGLITSVEKALRFVRKRV
jgi:hypothetical protein